MKKKICIFCSLPSFNTGMPISTYKLAAGLVKGGRFDVCAVLPGEGELAERMRSAGVEVDIIPFSRLRANPALLPRFFAGWIRAGLRLYKYVRRNGVDVAHFSDVIDAPFYPWARIAGARVAAHVRVCAGGPVVRTLFRIWTDIFCSRVITVSRFVRRYYGFRERAAVVYNPGPDREVFDIDKYRGDNYKCQDVVNNAGGDFYGNGGQWASVPLSLTITQSSIINDKVPAVLAVASFRRDKGHHNFIEIAAGVRERVSGDVRFVIVGGMVRGHERYYDEVMAAARRRGLGGCLTVTGNVPHERVPQIMANAAALVHAPDWEEALGGVILEAMAMGVAVVAYDCGGVGECFTDGVSGFLIKRGDFDSAAGKIADIIQSPELREHVAVEARRELDSKFTIDRYINGVENVYDGMF